MRRHPNRWNVTGRRGGDSSAGQIDDDRCRAVRRARSSIQVKLPGRSGPFRGSSDTSLYQTPLELDDPGVYVSVLKRPGYVLYDRKEILKPAPECLVCPCVRS